MPTGELVEVDFDPEETTEHVEGEPDIWIPPDIPDGARPAFGARGRKLFKASGSFARVDMAPGDTLYLHLFGNHTNEIIVGVPGLNIDSVDEVPLEARYKFVSPGDAEYDIVVDVEEGSTDVKAWVVVDE